MSALAAVIEDGIHAVYQPIVDLASGEVVAPSSRSCALTSSSSISR